MLSTASLPLLVAAQLTLGATTVAVAPFTADAPEREWIADALARDLTLRLHKATEEVNVFTVRQGRAAFKQVDDGEGRSERAAKQLGADVLIEGRVQEEAGAASVLLTFVHRVPKKGSSTSHVIAGRLDAPMQLEIRVGVAVANELQLPSVAEAAPRTTVRGAWRTVHRALSALAPQSLDPRAADASRSPQLEGGTLEDIRTDATDALALDRTLSSAHAALAVVSALEGKSEDATKQLGHTDVGSQDPFVPVAQAFVHMRAGRFDAAIAGLTKAVEAHPGYMHALGSLALLYRHLGRFREARAMFNQYVERVPNQPWARIQLGYVLARLRKTEESLAITQEAVNLNPKSGYLLTEFAARLIDAGKLEDAKAQLSTAITHDRGRADSHVRLGYVLLRLGDIDGAIRVSQQGINLAISPRESRLRGYAHLNLARAYGHKGDLDAAFSHLSRAVRLGLDHQREFDADPKLAPMRADPRYAKLEET